MKKIIGVLVFCCSQAVAQECPDDASTITVDENITAEMLECVNKELEKVLGQNKSLKAVVVKLEEKVLGRESVSYSQGKFTVTVRALDYDEEKQAIRLVLDYTNDSSKSIQVNFSSDREKTYLQSGDISQQQKFLEDTAVGIIESGKTKQSTLWFRGKSSDIKEGVAISYAGRYILDAEFVNIKVGNILLTQLIK